MRFQEALISGWGWTFRYEITQVVGEEYGDVQRDLLGSVVPIWDDAVAAPEPGFTTRFEMRRRTDKGADLESDLACFLSDDDRTSLAILAASGLERLEVDGRVWALSVDEKPDGSLEATALSERENRLWQLFPEQFQPSNDAVACFLEHRKIQPSEEEREQMYADAARLRRVLGVLPLNNDGTPVPPTRGRVYATLPTEVTLPFGLHINADWLLNISRSGLREIEDNPWQRDIVDRIADILARFLNWSADTLAEPAAVKAAFKGLTPPLTEAGGLETLLAEESCYRGCATALRMLRCFLFGPRRLGRWRSRSRAIPLFRLRPWRRRSGSNRSCGRQFLLKGSVLMDDVLGPNALKLLRRIGLLAEMSPRELERAWEGGLEDWWKTLPDEQGNRRRLLFRIWAAVADLTSEEAWRDADLPCIRSVTGKWLPVGEVAFLNEVLPAETEPGGPEACQFMEPFVPDENRLDDGWVSVLRKQKQKEPEHALLLQAWNWIEEHARSISLQEVVGDAVNALMSSTNPDWSVLVPLGHWAKNRNRADLLTHVLVESKSVPRGIFGRRGALGGSLCRARSGSPTLVLGGSPQLQRPIWKRTPRVPAPMNGVLSWRRPAPKAGSKCDPWRPMPVNGTARTSRSSSTLRLTRSNGRMLGATSSWTSTSSQVFPIPMPPNNCERRLLLGFDDGFRVLKGKGRRQSSYFYYSDNNLKGSVPSVWVTKLSKLPWVHCEDGKLRRPQDVLSSSDPAREDAPVAKLSSKLRSVLKEEGMRIRFGDSRSYNRSADSWREALDSMRKSLRGFFPSAANR